jgi:Protein of unknown function (DUF2786)
MNIVEKIKKLLALAESSNANEAALAASRAQELMVKYAIEEAALAPEQRTVEVIGTEIITTDYKLMPIWHALLAYVLAPSFFCRSFYHKGGKWSKAAIYMVGTPTDRAACIATYNVLKHDIEKMAAIEWAKQPEEFAVHGRRWKTSFYDGVCATIRVRLTDDLKALAADNTGTAIVLADKQKAVNDYTNEHHNLKSGGSARNVDASGFAAGVKAGNALNLSKRNTKQLVA